jgi:N-acetylglucosaminyl-diphospho-decaprenol L-rhamnosyltransferase
MNSIDKPSADSADKTLPSIAPQQGPPLVSVIIVSYNTKGLLHECMGALCASASEISLQIIFVDNASTDGSAALIKKDFPDCHLIENTVNVGFGRANNQALQFVQARYVLLLNTDAFVAVDTLDKTVAFMNANPECGILGVRLTGRNGELQPAARYFPTPWNLFLKRSGLHRWPAFNRVRLVDDPDWNLNTTRSCDWVPGCYYLVRKEVIDEVGLFDPRYFLYCEEVDHCLATKRSGWSVACFPGTTVIHIGGESAKSDGAISTSGRQIEALRIESELLYFRKNHGLIATVAYVFLTSVEDLIGIARCVVKGRPSIDIYSHLKHAAFVFSKFRETQWGKKPTR